MELLEDAGLMRFSNAGPRVRHADGEVAVGGRGAHAYLASVRKLDGVPTRLSSTWVKRCSSPRPAGMDLATSVLRLSFLLCASDSVADRTVSTTLSMAYSAMFRVNWP